MQQALNPCMPQAMQAPSKQSLAAAYLVQAHQARDVRRPLCLHPHRHLAPYGVQLVGAVVELAQHFHCIACAGGFVHRLVHNAKAAAAQLLHQCEVGVEFRRPAQLRRATGACHLVLACDHAVTCAER
jgi:hypothetical protein